MKITRENFKNIVRETMIEENEYQNFFKKALEKTGKSIPDMSDEEKKAFFNKIDSAWKGRGEKNEELVGNQKKLDIDGDGEIEASDLAALRAGKKKNERFGRGAGVGPTFGSADESVNEDFKAVVGKKVYSDGKGKLFFGYEKEDDSVHLVDYKTWKNLTAKNLSNEFMANRLINAIVKGQKQFNKKVDYNMWSNKTKPSFEQRMDYFMKNGWISNINKGGIKESVDVLSVNEATLKQGTKLRYDKNNFVVDYVVDKKYTGKDGFPKYTLKVVKSNFPNKIKVGSTEEYEDSKLTGLIRNKVMNFVKNESVNEIQYKDAVAKFNDELIKHPMVKKAAQHYKKTPAEIVKVLQQRLSTKGNRGGDTKEVSIDFKDTDSGITVKHKKSFNESVNEGKKRFKQQDGIGSSKYTISYHDGVKKHKDGSDFFDIKIFKNKPDLEAFKKDLVSKGFVKESVNEDRDSNMFYVLYQKQGVFSKPAAVGYKDRKDAEKFANSLKNHNTMILDKQSMKNVKGVDVKESVNEEKYTVIDPKGNSLGTADKTQVFMAAKKKGGENAGYFVVSAKNALKARRALEKFKGDFKNPKLKDIMAGLYESVNEASIDIKVGDMVKVDNPHWKGKGEKNESFADPLEGFPQAYKDLLKKLQRSNDRGERHMLINKMNVIRKKLKLKPLTNESVKK